MKQYHSSFFIFSLFLISFCGEVFGQSSQFYQPYNPYYSNMSSSSNNFCYECLYNPGQWGSPSPLGHNPSFNNNWLGNYGKYRYQNWNYPGVWNNSRNTLNAYSYPNSMVNPSSGHQGGGLGKPYIYVSGPVGESIKINIDFNGGTHWVSSPPAKNGWHVTLGEDEQLIVESAKYKHLFYDYQIDELHLQFSEGFCGDKKFILKEMVYILRFLEFQKNEISEFVNYWSNKIPKAKGYCVFPQDNRQLSKGAKISYDKKAKFTRVNYLIILNPKKNRFPQQVWKPEKNEIKSKFQLREWGVGFLLR